LLMGGQAKSPPPSSRRQKCPPRCCLSPPDPPLFRGAGVSPACFRHHYTMKRLLFHFTPSIPSPPDPFWHTFFLLFFPCFVLRLGFLAFRSPLDRLKVSLQMTPLCLHWMPQSRIRQYLSSPSCPDNPIARKRCFRCCTQGWVFTTHSGRAHFFFTLFSGPPHPSGRNLRPGSPLDVWRLPAFSTLPWMFADLTK